MDFTPLVQRNLYKGIPPRAWIRLQFVAADGSPHERQMLADTSSPCAVILGNSDLDLLKRAASAGVNSNFGHLTGAWFELDMPELNLKKPVLGFGSDQVLNSVQAASSDFTGLVGLPLLRLVEYGGDAAAFWLRQPDSAGE